MSGRLPREPKGVPDEARGARHPPVPIPEIRFHEPETKAETETSTALSIKDLQWSSPLLEPLPEYDRSRPLEDQLFERSVPHPHEPSFWPTEIWKALMTRESIQEALKKCGFTSEVAEKYARDIIHPQGARTLIFTIFMLLEKTRMIEHVLKCDKGLRDNRLPLVMDRIQMKLKYDDGQWADCCFHDLSWVVLENFVGLQRRFSVPVFRLSDGDNKIIHSEFDGTVILPWCEEKSAKPVTAMSGGFGSVIRVKIHPRCHGFHEVLKSINVADGLFAVKILKTADKVDFRKEVDALERFNGLVHRHLVTLLATFTQNDKYHMIFPWAQCDLDRYWETIEPSPDLKDIELIRWLSKQCLGIMEAVNVIHNPTHLAERRYGRHGDIKAENILWYPNEAGKRGILVISDLGLASMNSVKSRSMQPNVGMKMTPSYRPPECDIEGGTVSRAFDVWTLGCLYLELICWLLQGWMGKQQFDIDRTTPFIYGASVDIFFDIESTGQSKEKAHVFVVKEEVSKKISELHEDVNCTRWMHAMLDIIEKDMLVVLAEDRRRKTSDSLLADLKVMDNRCQIEPDYCLKKDPRSPPVVRRRPTGTLAELSEAARKNVELRPISKIHQNDGRALHRSMRPDQLKRID